MLKPGIEIDRRGFIEAAFLWALGFTQIGSRLKSNKSNSGIGNLKTNVDLEAMLAQIEKEQLAQNQSIIVNFVFNSPQAFEYSKADIAFIFSDIESWAFDPSRKYVKRGPAKLVENSSVSYAAFTVHSNDNTYIEGFRLCGYGNQPQQGILQYSAPEKARVLSVVRQLIKRSDMSKLLKSASYRVVGRFIDPTAKGTMEHFAQFEQKLAANESYIGNEFPFSDEIIGLFRSRGWNLYEVKPGIAPRMALEKVISGGAVQEVMFDTSYAVIPAAKNPADFKDVRKMIEYSKSSPERQPRIRLNKNGIEITPVLDTITLNRDAVHVRLYQPYEEMALTVKYDRLKLVLDSLSHFIMPTNLA